jgi:predicted dehydrogenase/nucleoside-diphosphate-sugar epimerase
MNLISETKTGSPIPRAIETTRDKDRPLRVGIIGCGRIAEHHLRFIAKTPTAQLVALSDTNRINALHLAEKYGAPRVCASHMELLDSSSPDVVHILTPPEFHYAQAVDAINHRSHILIEKPCTLYPDELEDLYRRADAKGVFLCPDFIQLFNPTYLEASSIIDSGELGKVVHIEIHLSLDLNAPELRETLGLHWSYKLPGGILHNNMTHVLYLALHRLGAPKRIFVTAQSHGTLPQGVTDHISVALEGEHCTANLVITGVTGPEPYYVQIFCERGNLLVNFDTAALVITRTGMLPRSLRRASATFQQSYQLWAQGIKNTVKFLRGRLLPYQGLETLIPRFYRCILDGNIPPVPKELAILVARTEAAVFEHAGKLHLETKGRPSKQTNVTRPEKILVTGATGYLGSMVVSRLVDQGYYVRALVRELSHTKHLEQLGVELVFGDIRNLNSLLDAAKGMDVVVHMAAALRGSSEFMLECSVTGTKNVAEAAAQCGLEHVIYISSMSVYDYFKLRDGDVISEESSLEEQPELRGTYSLAKRRAEHEALSHLLDNRPNWTILRPSVLVGNSANLFSPVGAKLGNFLLCPGSAGKLLRLVHVEDVADAISNAVKNRLMTRGRVFNVSNGRLTQKQYIDQYVRNGRNKNLRVIYIPFWLASLGAGTLRILRVLSHRVPNINKLRLAYLYRSVEASSEALTKQTGWHPRENLLETLASETKGT